MDDTKADDIEPERKSRPGSGINRSEDRRPGLFEKESDELIDMILAGRTKKFSIDLPLSVHMTKPSSTLRLRKFIVKAEKDYKHLMGEVDGATYEHCGRPEVEIHTISTQKITHHQRLLEKRIEYTKRDKKEGVKRNKDQFQGELIQKADSEDAEAHDMEGIRILYEPVKHIYIMSQLTEDFLLLRLADFAKKRSMEELVTTKCTCSMTHDTFNVMDTSKQRVWRRYVREFLDPLALSRTRIIEARHRVKKSQEAEPEHSDSDDSRKKIKKQKGEKNKSGGGGGGQKKRF